jgi:hypothetical protein
MADIVVRRWARDNRTPQASASARCHRFRLRLAETPTSTSPASAAEAPTWAFSQPFIASSREPPARLVFAPQPQNRPPRFTAVACGHRRRAGVRRGRRRLVTLYAEMSGMGDAYARSILAEHGAGHATERAPPWPTRRRRHALAPQIRTIIGQHGDDPALCLVERELATAVVLEAARHAPTKQPLQVGRRGQRDPRERADAQQVPSRGRIPRAAINRGRSGHRVGFARSQGNVGPHGWAEARRDPVRR